MVSKLKNSKYLSILITVIVFLIIYLLGRTIPQETIKRLIEDAGPLGPFVFILLSLLTYVVAPLSSVPLLFVGFYAFGKTVVIYSVFAAFISSIINFLIARKWGRSIVKKFLGEREMEKIDKLAQNYGLPALFLLRLFQGGIHDFISYAAGLTQIKFSSYILVTILGMIPGAIVWYFVSGRVNDPTSFLALNFALILISTILLAVGSLVHKRIKR
ncbi:MAG: hypothetical protein ACD_37C00604G0001 [uncultured bacterium]|nr:MAG: hypothetical protein ACD_37C00604G0001 [uncultured bacterium]